MSARQALSRFRAPDEPAVQERAWTVIRAAYVERPTIARRRSHRRLVLVPALIVLLAAATLSPAGATVRRWIRHALGVPHAAPALFRLPAPGSVLISGAGGPGRLRQTARAGASARGARPAGRRAGCSWQ